MFSNFLCSAHDTCFSHLHRKMASPVLYHDLREFLELLHGVIPRDPRQHEQILPTELLTVMKGLSYSLGPCLPLCFPFTVPFPGTAVSLSTSLGPQVSHAICDPWYAQAGKWKYCCAIGVENDFWGGTHSNGELVSWESPVESRLVAKYLMYGFL